MHPTCCRSLIRFSHDERAIGDSLTDETLDAVGRYEAEYQQTIRSARPQGPAALLAMGLADDPFGLGTPRHLVAAHRVHQAGHDAARPQVPASQGRAAVSRVAS